MLAFLLLLPLLLLQLQLLQQKRLLLFIATTAIRQTHGKYYWFYITGCGYKCSTGTFTSAPLLQDLVFWDDLHVFRERVVEKRTQLQVDPPHPAIVIRI